MFEGYPNMSESADDKFNYQFEYLLLLAKKKSNIITEIKALVTLLLGVGILLLPILFPSLDFVTFIINTFVWLIVILVTCVS